MFYHLHYHPQEKKSKAKTGHNTINNRNILNRRTQRVDRTLINKQRNGKQNKEHNDIFGMVTSEALVSHSQAHEMTSNLTRYRRQQSINQHSK